MTTQADTDTPTLTEFLTTRLLEELGAAEVARSAPAKWRFTVWPHDGEPISSDFINKVFAPERKLAEVEAKRRIVELHSPWHVCVHDHGATDFVGKEDDSGGEPCPTLRALASVYADHPDYRQEWA